MNTDQYELLPDINCLIELNIGSCVLMFYIIISNLYLGFNMLLLFST